VLKQERQLAVHHPQKTWFIVEQSDTGNVLVGNICPHLTPLHVVFKTPPETSRQRQEYLVLLTAMFEKYLLLAKNFGHKLDEGLSNFAVDQQGAVYYLDDEYYSWDNFVAFAVMLGVFIRSYDWLDKPFIGRLTKQLVMLIDQIFQDPHCRIIIHNQLQSVFMPSVQKEQILKKLLTGLSRMPITAVVHPANKKKLNARKNNSNRYYAIMADIHANDAALECTLNFYREHNITQGIVLGDIVGYGPEPQRCIELLQDSSFEIIKGNHDHATATASTERGFSGNAKIVIDWTIGQLTQSEKDWLNSLPAFSHHQHWLALHGAPIDPAFFYGYVYPLTAEENLDYLQQKNIALCLHGHSHMPGVFARDSRYHDHYVTKNTVDLNQYAHALVCPGSVGQPRNGVASAQCAIYDREKKAVEFINLVYSLDSVIEKMQRFGLPEALWQRLLAGK
jgi:predicted phosphodiesterase